jgi:GntR family transcriptional regulator, transcriptional repressor for pyruvate dehydrogenase complex
MLDAGGKSDEVGERTEAKTSAVIRTTAELRRRILLGHYRVGAALPGERDLAAELEVSRLTLRSAISHLEAEGLVRAVHGSGTRVLDHRETGGLDLFGHLASMVLSGQPVPGGLDLFSGLLELRRAVAVDAVGLATERASAEELLELRDHVRQLAMLTGDAHRFMVHDLLFARRIVRATKNLAFELLFNSVVRAVEGHPGIELAFFANATSTIAVYGRLLDRMEARDAERARATASRLLYRLDRTTTDALSQLLMFQASMPRPAPTPLGAQPERAHKPARKPTKPSRKPAAKKRNR